MKKLNKRGFPTGHRSLEQTEEWYNEAFKRTNSGVGPYAGDWNTLAHRVVTWYPALLLCRGSGPILELGCGPGHLAQMCEVFGIDYLLGVDYSIEAISAAKKKAPSSTFLCCDILSCKQLLGDNQDATVVILEVLEHIFDDMAVLELLSPGQKIVLSVPNFHAEGHVRWFARRAQVRERYGKVLDIERIVFEKHRRSASTWFIASGTRK